MLTVLSAIIKAFFDICLLRKQPQDLPKSTELLILCCTIYMVINMLLTMQSRTFSVALTVSLVDTGFLLAVTSLILRQHQHIGRWHQTVTALFGTGVILSIFSLPLVFAEAQNQYEGWLQQIIVLLFLIVIVWNVVILAHIVRHAISTSMGIGIMIAILYVWINSLLVTMLLVEMSFQ